MQRCVDSTSALFIAAMPLPVRSTAQAFTMKSCVSSMHMIHDTCKWARVHAVHAAQLGLSQRPADGMAALCSWCCGRRASWCSPCW